MKIQLNESKCDGGFACSTEHNMLDDTYMGHLMG
jgi:hypothetical protein